MYNIIYYHVNYIIYTYIFLYKESVSSVVSPLYNWAGIYLGMCICTYACVCVCVRATTMKLQEAMNLRGSKGDLWGGVEGEREVKWGNYSINIKIS